MSTTLSIQLPPELLSIIFTLSLPLLGFSDYSRCSAPINVSQVCRRWRFVALATPFLWSHLEFTNSDRYGYQQQPQCVDIWELWLARSKPMNLHFTIDVTCMETFPGHSSDRDPYEWGVYPFLQLMAENSDRWRTLCVYYSYDMPPYVIFVPTAPSSLETIELDGGVTIIPMPTIDVTRLNTYISNFSDEISHPQLDPLKPMVIYKPWGYGAPETVDPSARNQTVTLPNVNEIRMTHRPCITRFTLGSYTLPALRSLILSYMGFVDNDDKGLGISALLRRSGASLVEMKLVSLCVSFTEMRDALLLSPNLISLKFTSCRFLGLAPFLEFLTPNQAGSSEIACPSLSSIGLQTVSHIDDREMAAMVDMIISRWHLVRRGSESLSISLDAPNVARLGRGYPSCGIAQMGAKREELERCVSEGLDLEVGNY